MGQGLHIKSVQIAAETLGVDMSKVTVYDTSTDKVCCLLFVCLRVVMGVMIMRCCNGWW